MNAIASVHIADVGPVAALSILRRAPTAEGLVHADVGLAAPLAGRPPRPQLGRVGLLAFWEAEAALDRFIAENPLADRMAGGWWARLEPVRRFGTWPGLPDSVPTERAVSADGPAVVMTLARTRWKRLVPFMRTSRQAELSAVAASGLLWTTALARPPFFATCSLWESTTALSRYAYGQRDRGHPAAIEADRARPFHHQSAFIRFRPTAATGALDGRNPLPAETLSV